MKKTKILSVILATVIIFGCFIIPNAASAEETVVKIGGETTSYNTSEFKSFLTNAKNGVLRLESDITVTATSSTGIELPTAVGEYTIDLNGFTLYSEATRFMDTKASTTNRKLTFKNGAITHTGTTTFIFIRHGIDLVFDDVKVTTAGNNSAYSAFCFRADGSTASSLTINNCEITTTQNAGAIFAKTYTTNTVSLIVDNSVLNPMVSTFADKKIDSVSITNTTVNVNASASNRWANFAVNENSIVSDSANGANIEGIVADGYLNTSVANNYTTLYIYDKDTLNISMKSGAAIRLGDVNGIRFYTTVDTAKLAELKKVEGNVVELGTLIAPADLVTGELTHEIGEANYVDVPYKNEAYFEDTTFVGSIVGIKPGNIGRKFIGRGYIKVTNGGTETYYYATQNDNERSLKSVAIALQGDISAEGQALYEAHKEAVDAWALAADWSAQ